MEEIFRRQGFFVLCTGGVLPGDVGSSIVGLHFLRNTTSRIDSPEEVFNSEKSVQGDTSWIGVIYNPEGGANF
ncbi:MAG: hypothetical protein ACOC9D_00655 [Thermodesulfobacteriota bacterium]